MVEYMKRTTDLPEETIRMCPDCRLRSLSAEMSTGTG
jgi:hypothetical protein